MLDDLGLGPSGPPIPPTITFSMVPFPKIREQRSTPDRFTFLVTTVPDEQGEKKKGSEEDLHVSVIKVEVISHTVTFSVRSVYIVGSQFKEGCTFLGKFLKSKWNLFVCVYVVVHNEGRG